MKNETAGMHYGLWSRNNLLLVGIHIQYRYFGTLGAYPHTGAQSKAQRVIQIYLPETDIHKILKLQAPTSSLELQENMYIHIFFTPAGLSVIAIRRNWREGSFQSIFPNTRGVPACYWICGSMCLCGFLLLITRYALSNLACWCDYWPVVTLAYFTGQAHFILFYILS